MLEGIHLLPAVIFHIFVVVAFWIDAKWHRHVSWKAACLWSLFWIGSALVFACYVGASRSLEDAKIFLAAYVLEKSLSLDNVFVFWLILQKWRIPVNEQHRVLMWGIWGAIVMRCVMITLGVQLVRTWHSSLWYFGIFLLLTGLYTLLKGGSHSMQEEVKPVSYPRWLDKSTHVFWHRGRPTLLLGALVSIEWSDVIFAVDSVPAIFGLTQDVFLIYTSNIMAILGLRSLYGVLQVAAEKLTYISYAVGSILTLVGLKMMGVIVLGPLQAIVMTLSIVLVSILASLFHKK